MTGTHKQVTQVTVAANNFPDNLLRSTPRIGAVASIPEQRRVICATPAISQSKTNPLVSPIRAGVNGSSRAGGTLVGFNTVRRLAIEEFLNSTGIGGKLSHPLPVITHIEAGRNGS